MPFLLGRRDDEHLVTRTEDREARQIVGYSHPTGVLADRANPPQDVGQGERFDPDRRLVRPANVTAGTGRGELRLAGGRQPPGVSARRDRVGAGPKAVEEVVPTIVRQVVVLRRLAPAS